MKKRESNQKRGTFAYDGPFYTVTGKIFDLAAVSIYWLVGCLPVITAGASFSAMYDAVTKSICNGQGSVSGVFWKAYRRDMKGAIPIWLVYAAAIFIMMLNFGILRENATGLVGFFFQMLYSVFVLFLLTAACYVFPLLSRFDMPAGWQIKLSLYMTVRYLPKSVLLLADFLLCYLLLLRQPVLVLVIPATGTLMAAYILEDLLARHMPKGSSDEEETIE